MDESDFDEAIPLPKKETPTQLTTLTQPTFEIQQFSEKDCYFVWIGTAAPQLANLAFAISTPFDTMPSVSNVLGTDIDRFSQLLAQTLTKRFKRPCYVSSSIPANLPQLFEFAQLYVLKVLKTKFETKPQ